MANDPRQLQSHFAFGENWQSFTKTVNAESIAEASRGLTSLFLSDEIRGRRFLDAGCGSGLSMLAGVADGRGPGAGRQYRSQTFRCAGRRVAGAAVQTHPRSARAPGALRGLVLQPHTRRTGEGATSFHGFVRIADAIGIPYQTAARGEDAAELREQAGISAFYRVREQA